MKKVEIDALNQRIRELTAENRKLNIAQAKGRTKAEPALRAQQAQKISQTDVDDLQSAYQSLSVRYDQLEEKIEQRWRLRFERLSAQSDQDQRQIARLKLRLEGKSQEAKTQNSRILGYEAALSDMKRSRSWRITAPLRKVVSLLRSS